MLREWFLPKLTLSAKMRRFQALAGNIDDLRVFSVAIAKQKIAKTESEPSTFKDNNETA